MELGILVIDDEDGIRRSLTRILKEDGYSVSVASNGEEALSLIRNNQNKYDIVICDLLMPGIDGITTIEEINKLNREVTKIILTGYGTLEYHKAIRKQGTEMESERMLPETQDEAVYIRRHI
jgi:DNA-binding NtrC family response regulator